MLAALALIGEGLDEDLGGSAAPSKGDSAVFYRSLNGRLLGGKLGFRIGHIGGK